jgi:hypothetical protein
MTLPFIHDITKTPRRCRWAELNKAFSLLVPFLKLYQLISKWQRLGVNESQLPNNQYTLKGQVISAQWHRLGTMNPNYPITNTP